MPGLVGRGGCTSKVHCTQHCACLPVRMQPLPTTAHLLAGPALQYVFTARPLGGGANSVSTTANPLGGRFTGLKPSTQ